MILPDFVIIGTMKSGSTTTFEWLGTNLKVWLPARKEPHFFSRPEVWELGMDWYGALFADKPDGVITGEASTSYTEPEFCDDAAERIAAALPEAQLLCVLRNPVQRARSHYRHEVWRGRESASFTEAMVPGSRYVQRSRYDRCLAPYFERFAPERLCIVTLEGLTDGTAAWSRVLDHLGLPYSPPPDSQHNAMEEKQSLNRVGRGLKGTRVFWSASRGPKFVRRIGKRVLSYDRGAFAGRVDESRGEFPPDSEAVIWADAEELETRLGTGPLWTR